jgi:flagellar basal-body rod protein FlgB
MDRREQVHARMRPVERRSVNSSYTSSVVNTALDALAARQRVIADNIANLQTPGFTARRVLFEEALGSAIAERQSARATGINTTTEPRVDDVLERTNSLEPTRLDGNNVNLDRETLLSMETNLRYRLMLRAVDSGFSLVRDSLRTQ